MRFIFLAALLAVSATPALAKPVTYACQMSQTNNGWIRPQVILQIDAAAGSARVLDDIVRSVHGKAKPGTLSVEGSQSIVTWTVLVEDSRGQDTNMRYRAALLKGNKVVVSATPSANYNGRFSARGRCAMTPGRYPGM
ncbi:MAG: hypothetical protein ACU0GG_02600 [Paracoccaceae bacterium]